jgi:hypothetical protein
VPEKPNITERVRGFVNNPWVMFVYMVLTAVPTVWSVARPILRILKMPGYTIVDRVVSGAVVFAAFAAFGIAVRWLVLSIAPKRKPSPPPPSSPITALANETLRVADDFLAPCIRGNHSFSRVLDRAGKGKPWYSELRLHVEAIEADYAGFRKAFERASNALEMDMSRRELVNQMQGLIQEMRKRKEEWRRPMEGSGWAELVQDYNHFIDGSLSVPGKLSELAKKYP